MSVGGTTSAARDAIKDALLWFYGHPVPRTVSMAINTIGGGFLVAWLVTEITVSDQIVLEAIWTTKVTLYVGGYILWFFFYHSLMWRFENRIYRWNSPAYVKARLTEELWDAFIFVARKRTLKGEFRSVEQMHRELLE